MRLGTSSFLKKLVMASSLHTNNNKSKNNNNKMEHQHQQQHSRESLMEHGKNAPLLDLVIIGGGLSGLTVARQVHHSTSSLSADFKWKLLEARSTFGGRISNDDMGDHIDLGGAWVWPGQHLMLNLIKELGLQTFSQPDDDYSGSRRVAGGAAAIVDKLVESLPHDCIEMNSPVEACVLLEDDQGGVEEGHVTDRSVLLAYHHEDNSCSSNSMGSLQFLRAKKVVFAVPPQILAQRIQLHGSKGTTDSSSSSSSNLSPRKVRAMEASRTWMAGVTKVSLIYDKPRFWDLHRGISNMGLPGRGPAFQVYDASEVDTRKTGDNDNDGQVALTFFVMAPSSSSSSSTAAANEELASACATQLSNLWQRMNIDNKSAMKLFSYKRFHVQRWPKERYISVEPNPTHVHPHPPVHPALAETEWEGLLHFAGTECDLDHPGLMEGAVGAGLRVSAAILESVVVVDNKK